MFGLNTPHLAKTKHRILAQMSHLPPVEAADSRGMILQDQGTLKLLFALNISVHQGNLELNGRSYFYPRHTSKKTTKSLAMAKSKYRPRRMKYHEGTLTAWG